MQATHTTCRPFVPSLPTLINVSFKNNKNVTHSHPSSSQKVTLPRLHVHLARTPSHTHAHLLAASPVCAIFISPAVTPRNSAAQYDTARNPAVRMYDYDPQQLHVTDIKQYYLDLPPANRYRVW